MNEINMPQSIVELRAIAKQMDSGEIQENKAFRCALSIIESDTELMAAWTSYKCRGTQPIKFADKHFDEIKEGTVLIGLMDFEEDGIYQGEEYNVRLTPKGALCVVIDDEEWVSLVPSYAEMFAIKESAL